MEDFTTRRGSTRLIMSYDINLTDPISGTVLELDEPHQMRGGTYAMGGTTKMSLNVTYNYALHYHAMGEKGIREIYGKAGAEAVPILERGISALSDETDPDYWNPTEGNAKRPLLQLLAFAKMRPDGVFKGD